MENRKVTCQKCGNEMDLDDLKCEFCGTERTDIKLCPYCNSILDSAVKKCKYCGEWVTKPIKKENNTIFPLWSFLIATLIGLGLTVFLGYFISDFYIHPLYPFVIISYTIHPLCRYKFNYKKMAEKHNLLKRLVVSFMVMHLLRMIAFYGNKIN